MNYAVIALFLSLLAAPVTGQDAKQQDDAMKNCAMHDLAAGRPHHATVESQGDQAMGFPHDKTTHHFRLKSDGGAIEVTVNDAKDATNLEAIRSHLSHIAIMFGNGDFSTPMFIHDGVPPGVTTMKLMKSAISYRYQEMPSGGRVSVRSTDAVAVAAIHDFIRFQIAEHETGDSLEMAEQ